jgi:hypothetical protein
VSQKHADPGSNPGWGTRFFAAANALPPALLQLGCGKEIPRRACSEPIGRAAGRVSSNSILAVAQLEARLVRDEEAAGSNPAGETKRFPRSSADRRARGYDPRGRGFDSLRGCQSRRRNSEERMPACRAGRRGFKSRRRRHFFRRVAQSREQLALTQQAAGSTPAAPTSPPRVAQSAERLPCKQEVARSKRGPGHQSLL